MFINDIEKQIIKEEKALRQQYEKPIYKVLHNEEMKPKIIKKVIELAKKEDIILDEDEVEYILDEAWERIREDFEYVPGYVDEYIEELKENFYTNEKLSLTKLSSYILKQIIG